MHYLIDGHNLISAMPDISLEDPDDEIKLILLLKSWAVARKKRKVTVIFDGGLPGGYEQRLSTSQINVLFASEGQTADSLLIARIKKIPNPPEYTLISSDRMIQDAAKSRKIRFLTSAEFVEKLSEKNQPSPPPKTAESDEPALSSDEVAQWMELFGPEPKIETPKPVRRKTTEKKEKAKPDPTQQDKSPSTAKRGERRLSRNEVDEWLDLFGDGK